MAAAKKTTAPNLARNQEETVILPESAPAKKVSYDPPGSATILLGSIILTVNVLVETFLVCQVVSQMIDAASMAFDTWMAAGHPGL